MMGQGFGLRFSSGDVCCGVSGAIIRREYQENRILGGTKTGALVAGYANKTAQREPSRPKRKELKSGENYV